MTSNKYTDIVIQRNTSNKFPFTFGTLRFRNYLSYTVDRFRVRVNKVHLAPKVKRVYI